MDFFFFKIYLLFIYFIYFWLHLVLVVAHRLLSSCGVQAPGCMGSVVVACGFQSPWAL